MSSSGHRIQRLKFQFGKLLEQLLLHQFTSSHLCTPELLTQMVQYTKIALQWLLTVKGGASGMK